MTAVVVIGLLWVAATGVLAVVIGRAIRHADREEERAQGASLRTTPAPRRRAGGAVPGTLVPPALDDLGRWSATDPRYLPGNDRPEDDED